MAELIVLSYRPGKTLLHTLDIRCKLLILILINILALNGSILVLMPLSVVLVALLAWQKIPLRKTLYQTRLFFLLLFFVFVSRIIFVSGDPLLETAFITFSKKGIQSGTSYCWRLVLVLFCGILLITSSKTTEIKAAIQWFLKPIPFVPEKRAGIMISLMIRFLPLVLEQSQEISEAQKARAVEQVKSPVRRLSLFTAPLIRRIFETADSLVMAMEARCFTEERTDPELVFTQKDILILIPNSPSKKRKNRWRPL